MLRLAPSFAWSCSLALLALPGCLVSFNDYPLGDPNLEPEVAAGRAGAAGSATVSRAGGSTGGSSSSASGAPDMPAEPTLLVDDFEDGDAAILEQQGRSGSWYAANDGRGMQTPANGMPLMPSALVPARGASLRGVHTFGGPFATWGALIGTVFVSNDSTGSPYDLSAYRGVRLWVRSGATSGFAAKQVRLNLRTPATVTGGTCSVCSDHFGVEIPLTAKWTRADVPFSMLKQVGYGQPKLAAVDLAHALGIELLFPPNVSFDLWVDDVELY